MHFSVYLWYSAGQRMRCGRCPVAFSLGVHVSVCGSMRICFDIRHLATCISQRAQKCNLHTFLKHWQFSTGWEYWGWCQSYILVILNLAFRQLGSGLICNHPHLHLSTKQTHTESRLLLDKFKTAKIRWEISFVYGCVFIYNIFESRRHVFFLFMKC